jgi:GTP-binding protein
MKITSVEFLKSVARHSDGPPGSIHEFAFIGRSNVGKSSLINMLCRRKNLARISGTPGKTQTLNFYRVNKAWHLVDLPGYGYASVSRSKRADWGGMISDYILKRQALTCLFVLIDSRLEPQAIDLDFIRWLGKRGVPFALVFTKADKPGKTRALANVRRFHSQLEKEWEELPPSFVTSAVTGEGRDRILAYMTNAVQSTD